MKVVCFIPFIDKDTTESMITELTKSEYVADAVVMLTENQKNEGFSNTISIDSVYSSETIKKIAAASTADYTLLYTGNDTLKIGYKAIDRFVNVATWTNAGMVYSNYIEVKDEITSVHPVIDYQEGSLRDDFNFGSILFYNSTSLKEAVAEFEESYTGAGLYDLRLRVSQKSALIRIPENLYKIVEHDTRKTGEKQFDYVDPKNRAIQIEMEKACTCHLKKVGAFLKPEFKDIDLDEGDFEIEASVIIPVRNRVRTIADAIDSVLKQKFDKDFNLIIVDNHSNDGTTEIIAKYAEEDSRLIHIIPERDDLGIGGCWNMGVAHSKCGRFAIQLDSDDLYYDETTIQQVIDTFHSEKCAMVVGTYKMTNFDLEEIPPGIIDHKEWTPENGRNNALRINGLGAPRAFFTPLLRKIQVPNCNYGEDYALGLAISREYQIGRIYNPIYLCRRWEDNSDASLDVVKANDNNIYKDRIRTIELVARKNLNKK